MGMIVDDMTVAFAMTCDEANLTYEQGAAEERRSYAVVEGGAE